MENELKQLEEEMKQHLENYHDGLITAAECKNHIMLAIIADDERNETPINQIG